jgi:Pyruvate/2-oxoacid:ferredoxin oxidoreductase delta subunit
MRRRAVSEAYDQLIKSLNSRGGSLPAFECDELHALLKEIFTEEQAEMFSRMPSAASLPEQIAERAGRSTEETVAVLEGMADSGLITTREREGGRAYSAIPLVPGIFEFQLMKGGTSERDKKLARLFDDFFRVARELPPGEIKMPTVPFSRVIPVEEEIKSGIEVYPYDVLSEYVENTEHISVSTCYCRHEGELIGDPCDKPKEVCLSFGPGAQFIAERGFGRPISKEEARKILDTAEDAGLIHCSSNTANYIDFVCNCCDCHCGIVQSLKEQMRNIGRASNFTVEVDADSCNSCEICVDRCPMDAIVMEDDIAVRMEERCVGCGLCVSSCGVEALRMVNRPERHDPPRNHRELMTSMMASIGQGKPASTQ